MRYFLLLLFIVKFSTCNNKVVESTFYTSLVNKEWALEVHDKYWSLCCLTMTEEKVLIDSITRTWAHKEYPPHYYLHTLVFKPDGKIEFLEKVKNLGLCGNGVMTINNGSWELDDDLLLIYVEGVYSLESKFIIQLNTKYLFRKKMKCY